MARLALTLMLHLMLLTTVFAGNVTNASRNLVVAAAFCDQIEAANPDFNCVCTRPSLLRNTGFIADCTSDDAFCIPIVGCFAFTYLGEFKFFRPYLDSTSEICFSETNRDIPFFCIKRVHCIASISCIRSCSATVGDQDCRSCSVCPDGEGVTADCTNVVPFLRYSDCDRRVL